MDDSGEMLKAPSASIETIDSDDLKTYLKDESVKYLMKEIRIKKRKIEAITIYTIYFEEGQDADEGIQATFMEFTLKNKKVKTAAIIGWGMIGVCQ